MRINAWRAVAGLAAAVVAASACLLGATTASAAPVAPQHAAKLMEIGTESVPASVQANLRTALATAERQTPNITSGPADVRPVPKPLTRCFASRANSCAA
jgi:hypothetical protein